jgi:hypothetical protein
MPTLAELLASIQAGQAAGMGETGAELSITAEGERRGIQSAQRQLVEQQKRAERQAKRREKRRGIGRLIGGTAGFLLGGAGGRAIGSAIGQSIGGAGQRVGRVSSGLGQGMFFGGAREALSSSESDINRFIGEANKGFTNQVLASAATDYLSGLRAQQLGMTPESLKDLGGATLEGIRTGGLGEGLGTIQDYFQSFKPGAFGSSSSLLDYSYGSRGIGAKPFVSDLSDYGVTVTGIRG